MNLFSAYNTNQPGDPKKGVQVMLDVVRGEGVAQGKEFPKSLLLGSDCFGSVQKQLDDYLKLQSEWKPFRRAPISDSEQ